MAEEKIVQYTMDQFKGMSTTQIAQLAKDSMSAFFQAAQLTDPKVAFQAMVIIARIGLEAKTVLSPKQHELVTMNFTTFYKGPMKDIYPTLVGDIAPEEYRMLEGFCKQGQDRIGIPLLTYLLCFACCDGGPSPELKQRLEEIFDKLPLAAYQRKDPTYQELLAQWEEARKPIFQKRSEQYKLRKGALQKAYLQQLAEERDAKIQEQTQRIAELERQLQEINRQIDGLSFLQFIKRKQLTDRCEEIKGEIRECNWAITAAKRAYERGEEGMESELRGQYVEISNQLDQEFPIPPKPKDPNARPSPEQIVADAYKGEIMKTIEHCGKLRVTELLKQCLALAGLTPQRVRPYLTALVAEGKLIETTKNVDGNICYYYEKA